MRDAWKTYLQLAGGVTEVTRQRAVAVAKALVAQGEATAEQVQGLAEDLLAQTRQNREAMAALVAFEVDRALARVGLVSADEVTALTDRVRELEQQLAATRAGNGPATVSAGQAPAQASGAARPAKKAPAQASAADAPAKKAPAKKAPAKKAPAKKAPAKRAAGQKAAGHEAPAAPATSTSGSDA